MRNAARAILIGLLTFLSVVVLGVASAMTAAVALAATALIVPGTGTHNIGTVVGYKENARDRFIAPADPSCTAANGCVLVGIPYPASFFPLGFPPFPSSWCANLSCKTWNVSVGEGVQNLDATLSPLLNNPDGVSPVVIFGYSQGGAVVSHEIYNLADLPQSTKDLITVVTIGNIENPQGLWSRLGFLPTIPGLNVTFGPHLPTNIGIRSYNYAFEYDPVGDAPLYVLNPLALLNAVAALEVVHGNYLVPNSNDPTGSLPYGYTDATLAAAIQNPDNIRTYQDATFILIPQQGTLPIMQPVMDLAAATGTTPFVKPVVDLLSPTFKVLIGLGYDRTANPGIPQTFQLFPIVDPITVTGDLINAAAQGIHDAANDVGGATAPSSPGPTPTSVNASMQANTDAGAEPNSATATGAGQLSPPTSTTTQPARPLWRSGNLFRPGATSPVGSGSDATHVTNLLSTSTAPASAPAPGAAAPAGATGAHGSAGTSAANGTPGAAAA